MLESRSSYQPGSLWFYAPNKGAPIAFAIMFATSGLFHLFQCYKYKSWKVTSLLPWSALLFTAGFVLRSIAAFGQWGNLNIYIASTVLLLAGPPVYEGANYFILGRILYYIPYHSPIHPGRVYTTFIALGVVIEVLTANGASRLANSDNPGSEAIGKGLLKAALILQIVLMAAFVALAGKFHSNCSRAGVLNHKVKRALIVLYCSCTLITIRTIYRTVEYFTEASLNVANIHSMSQISPILKQEWFFYFFEATVMFCNSSMLNIFHPMQCLPRSNNIYLATDGVTEVEGPGYEDKRHWALTVVDPFDIGGMFSKRDRLNKFWETDEAQKNDESSPRSQEA